MSQLLWKTYINNLNKTQKKYNLKKISKKDAEYFRTDCVNVFCNSNDNGSPTCNDYGFIPKPSNPEIAKMQENMTKNGWQKSYSQSRKKKLMKLGAISGCQETEIV